MRSRQRTEGTLTDNIQIRITHPIVLCGKDKNYLLFTISFNGFRHDVVTGCELNCPGPDRSISNEALEKGELLRSRRYRNRRLGDFLKELDLTEGRSTGVPTIQEKLRANGSPRAVFETDEDRLAFLVTIPVHEGCENRLSSETSSETPKRTIDKILRIIKGRPGITNAELANILGISPRAVGKHLKKLRNDNRIVRVGSPTYGGGWETLEE